MEDVQESARGIEDLRLIVVDYAQEVADSDPSRPRYLQVGDVARRSVQMAQEFKVPVLICSQVNSIKGKSGEVEDYTFRETSVLEQKASLVLIFAVKWQTQDGHTYVDGAEIICRKHRGGPQFRLPVHYNPSTFTVSALREEREWTGSTREIPGD